MARRIVALAAVVLAASFLALAPAPARAEEDPLCSHQPGVVCIPTTVVRGTVQRPSAVYVLDRGRLEVSPVRAEQTFTRDIVDSLRRAPF